jgi:hypothetical protein
MSVIGRVRLEVVSSEPAASVNDPGPVPKS